MNTDQIQFASFNFLTMMENVNLKVIPNLIIKEQDVIPKSEIDTDFIKVLKQEIYNDVNQIESKIKLETGFCKNPTFETNSNLKVYSECVSSNKSEKLTEDQLASCQNEFSLISCNKPEKTLNPQHVNKKILSSKRKHGQSHVAVSKGLNFGKRVYKCDTCNTLFDDILVPKESCDNTYYNCKICYKAFDKSQNFAYYKGPYSKDKPYKCDICFAAFPTKFHRTRHTRTHTGEKPYECDICSAAFATQSNLTQHKSIHTGEKPYKCDICSSAFATQSNLTQHKRRHTGEKP